MKKFEELKQELKAMCPNCDGGGTIMNGINIARTVCDQETGEPLYQVPDIDYEASQCQWCYEFDLKLAALLAAYDESKWKTFTEELPETGQLIIHISPPEAKINPFIEQYYPQHVGWMAKFGVMWNIQNLTNHENKGSNRNI